jgi:hypothetical protein
VLTDSDDSVSESVRFADADDVVYSAKKERQGRGRVGTDPTYLAARHEWRSLSKILNARRCHDSDNSKNLSSVDEPTTCWLPCMNQNVVNEPVEGTFVLNLNIHDKVYETRLLAVFGRSLTLNNMSKKAQLQVQMSK